MAKDIILRIEDSIKKHWDRDALTDYRGATLQYKDVAVARIEDLSRPKPTPNPDPKPGPVAPQPPKKVIKHYNRSILFPAKQLESETDVDAYVNRVRDQLMQLLRGCDGIKLN